ncbi:hypothetical protein CFOL_v3_07596, partial [Cephalotus follicularis]
ILHVVYRVGELDRTIKFCTECFEMKLLRKETSQKRNIPTPLGFGREESNFVVELTYSYV